MKKTVALLLALLLLLCAACDKAAPAANTAAPRETKESASPATGSAVADFYNAYLQARSEAMNKISDALADNPATEVDSLALLRVALMDLALLPAGFLGLGQEAMNTGLKSMGASDVQYTENGGNYTVICKGKDGENYEFRGSYDAAAEALVCTVRTDGNDSVYAEYRKTTFGYIGQVYSIDEDGAVSLIQIAIQGEDGVIGFADGAGKPAALTGGEKADFPKGCAQWYAVNGTTVTGVTGDGREVNITYTP